MSFILNLQVTGERNMGEQVSNDIGLDSYPNIFIVAFNLIDFQYFNI